MIVTETKIRITLEELKAEVKRAYMTGTEESKRERRENNFEIYWKTRLKQLL